MKYKTYQEETQCCYSDKIVACAYKGTNKCMRTCNLFEQDLNNDKGLEKQINKEDKKDETK